MNEKLLALLKTKFAGVQDAILKRVAQKHSASLSETSSDEEIQAVADSVQFQTVIDSYADSRVTEAARTAVQNYEQRHGIKDGKPVQNPQPANLPADAPEWAKTLITQNQALQARVDEFSKRDVSKNLAETVKTKLKEQGVKDSFFVGRDIVVETPEQVDSVVETMLGYWTEVKKDMIPNEVPPQGAFVTGSKTVDADIESWAGKK